MKKELITKLMLAMVMILASVSFTACDDEDDSPPIQVYTYGWTEIHASGSDLNYLTEMGIVDDAFKTALGSDSPVTLNGSTSDCDAKIKAACEKAATSLKDKTWSFTANFEVTNQITEEVVYSLQFTQGSTLAK